MYIASTFHVAVLLVIDYVNSKTIDISQNKIPPIYFAYIMRIYLLNYNNALLSI